MVKKYIYIKIIHVYIYIIFVYPKSKGHYFIQVHWLLGYWNEILEKKFAGDLEIDSLGLTDDISQHCFR